jgi:hypothetical protein
MMIGITKNDRHRLAEQNSGGGYRLQWRFVRHTLHRQKKKGSDRAVRPV